MIKVSVIVPIYKVEQYIEVCVRSLFEQTMKAEIEYLFINDCSPDQSLDILKLVMTEYPDRIPQIRIIDLPENKGTAYVRTLGLKEAKGEYIIFCDSDDWTDKEMYETMYAAAKEQNVDIVTCNYIRHDKSGVYKSSYSYKSNTKDVIRTLSEQHIFKFSVVTNKMVRRSIFTNNDCFPYQGINVAEDMNMWIRVFHYANTLYHLSDCYFYHYNRMNENSVCVATKQNYDFWISTKNNIERIADFLLSVKDVDYKTTCNFLKFFEKNSFRNVMTEKEFYNTWKESHVDIMKYKYYSLKSRIVMTIAYSSYCLFKFILGSK